jgi:guanylate kinase
MEGNLVIISAPSGAGKTTIVRHLLNSGLKLSFSVSATTRPPRGREINGIDYFFISVPDFIKKIENNEFVEWEEVYKDLFYGTLKSELERIWATGHHVLFDVDVMGGINLKKIFGDRAISIFIMPPSVEELEKRLLKRATDTPEKIKMRVEKAREEMILSDQFDTVVVNNILAKANEEVRNIVAAFLEDKTEKSNG